MINFANRAMAGAIILALLISCVNRDTAIDKSKILGSDYRLFQNTPVWPLAKLVEDGDTAGIHLFGLKNKRLIDYCEPVYGQTLLQMAVYQRNYNSVKALLESGADPNKQSVSDRMSAFMLAATLSNGGIIKPKGYPKFLIILLKYGGDPNALQIADKKHRDSTYFTPFLFACQ
jgi:hypothetical protein